MLAKWLTSTLTKHVNFLESIDMMVGKGKPEITWISKFQVTDHQSITFSNVLIHFTTSIKALGVVIQGDLCWHKQSEESIRKGTRLLSSFKYLRKYLTESQFLKAVSAHFYGAVFYCCSVWFEITKWRYKEKFDSLYFRLLRSACSDYS